MTKSGQDIIQFSQPVQSLSSLTMGGRYPASFISPDSISTCFGHTKMQMPQSSTPLHEFVNSVIRAMGRPSYNDSNSAPEFRRDRPETPENLPFLISKTTQPGFPFNPLSFDGANRLRRHASFPCRRPARSRGLYPFRPVGPLVLQRSLHRMLYPGESPDQGVQLPRLSP